MSDTIKSQVEAIKQQIKVYTLSIEDLKKRIQDLQNSCEHPKDKIKGEHDSVFGCDYDICTQCGKVF